MSPFLLLSKWFWALCIVITFFNARQMQTKANRQILAHPEAESGLLSANKGISDLWLCAMDRNGNRMRDWENSVGFRFLSAKER